LEEVSAVLCQEGVNSSSLDDATTERNHVEELPLRI
jgi:hypothetical protein